MSTRSDNLNNQTFYGGFIVNSLQARMFPPTAMFERNSLISIAPFTPSDGAGVAAGNMFSNGNAHARRGRGIELPVVCNLLRIFRVLGNFVFMKYSKCTH